MTHIPRSVIACAIVACSSAGLADVTFAQQNGRLAGSVKGMTGHPIKGGTTDEARDAGAMFAELK